ncbi:hypothetical protein HYW59_00035 [Candidatus Kaiserbacteria bacterium]|nr:hypothetical protein [Candidatus Kaiserbacteria bacterium]
MTENNQVVVSVLEVLDEVGLNHSCTMGKMRKMVIVEGGLSDPMKAFRVSTFRDAISDDEGFINDHIVQQNMLRARRALLAYVADVLQKKGAILKSKNDPHGLTVDETYHFIIEGQEIYLALMPR